MSRHSRPSRQVTKVNRSRDPWAVGDCGHSTTTNSSSTAGSRTYHGIPSDGLSSPIYQSPYPPDDVLYENDPFSYGSRHAPSSDVDASYRGDRRKMREHAVDRQYGSKNNENFHHARVYPEDSPETRFFNRPDQTIAEMEPLNITKKYHHEDTKFHHHNSKNREDYLPKSSTPYVDETQSQMLKAAYQQHTLQRLGSTRHHQPTHTSSGSASERAQSPASATTGGTVEGCGGHCVAFQNFCYYFLQVVFVIGILTGISLCIAGSVLRRNRGRDLSVLLYIGSLISMVCALLLSIHCCVRRNIKRRKKALRLPRNNIQMTDIGVSQQQTVITLPTQQVQRLLSQEHQFDSRGGFARDTFRSGMSSVPIMANTNAHRISEEHDGIPWWRRGNNV